MSPFAENLSTMIYTCKNVKYKDLIKLKLQKWNHVRRYSVVCAHSSTRGLSQAGEYLSLPAATVTRRLQRLESRLGQKLLHRSARQFTLTQQGEVYYQSYASLVEQFEQTSHHLNQQKEQLSGKLKVLAPLNICHGF